MESFLSPILAKIVEDEWVKLERSQITPWAFMTAGPPFRCQDFYGKQISYQGVKFEGSPRDVFWGRYIEPFIEDIAHRIVQQTIQLCAEKNQSAQRPLAEAGELLKSVARRVYKRMAEIDQRLRAEGFPDRVQRKNIDSYLAKMTSFIDKRVQAEIAMAKDREKQRESLPWWKTALAKFSLIPLGSMMACLALVHAYKTTGANELRTQVYQPLYADLIKVETSIQAASAEHPAFMKALQELKGSGALEQIPLDIREPLIKISEEVATIQNAIIGVREIAIREMSARILQIRTKEKDYAWQNRTESILRAQSKAQKGYADTVTLLSKMNHETRSRSVDLRNPNQPEIAGPGGPIFVIRDWLNYPDSIKAIEGLWADEDYLYFNDQQDSWYYRITREDLVQIKTNLTDFLNPTFLALSQNPDFMLLLTSRPAFQMQLRSIKISIEERIRDPKQLGDLVSS